MQRLKKKNLIVFIISNQYTEVSLSPSKSLLMEFGVTNTKMQSSCQSLKPKKNHHNISDYLLFSHINSCGFFGTSGISRKYTERKKEKKWFQAIDMIYNQV